MTAALFAVASGPIIGATVVGIPGSFLLGAMGRDVWKRWIR